MVEGVYHTRQSIEGIRPGHGVYLYRTLRWTISTMAAGGVFAAGWWFCEGVLQMPRGDAIGIAAIPSTLAGAPLTWWSGRERETSTKGRHQQVADKHGEWPLVRDADPLVFGVHKTRQDANKGTIPEYIDRDIDGKVEEIVNDAVTNGGLVLLAGDSASGKTRTAFSAMAKLLPDYRVINPPRGVDFRNLIDTIHGKHKKYMLWLDDLEGYIGIQGLQPDIVDNLTSQNVAIISTIRHEQLDHFRRTSTGGNQNFRNEPTKQAAYVGSRIINIAKIVDVPRKWSMEEIKRASYSEDDRIREALEQSHTYGVAEYVAAGPQLLEDWKRAFRVGGNPRGAALVSAAIDLARAGLTDPIPRPLIEEAHHTYLLKEGGELLHPESIEKAVEWASEVRYGVTSLLRPSPNDHWSPFDYLVDVTARESLDPPPGEVWQAALRHVSSARGYYAIGINALYFGKVDITEKAWSTAAAEGSSSAAVELGTLFWQLEQFEKAETWYSTAYELGSTRAALRAGDMFACIGRLNDAQSWWNLASDHGIPQASIRQVIDANYLEHSLTKVLSDSSTRDNLGDLGISETLLNLWPIDCQTCGYPLGEQIPSLCFSDIIVRRNASLHHAVCREPGWHADNHISSNAFVSWRSISFVTGINRGDTVFRQVPIIIVNPTLEVVWIHNAGDEWRVSTIDQYLDKGFIRINRDVPLPDTPAYSREVPYATLTRDSVSVSVDFASMWSASIDQTFFQAAKELDGFSLWITTRMNPEAGTLNPQNLEAIISDGGVAGRWIYLDPKKNDSRNMERSSRDYILYWTSDYAVVGEVVKEIAGNESAESAFRQAADEFSRLEVDVGDQDWTSVDSTGGWMILDGISAKHYFLHRHKQKWRLTRAIALRGGIGFGDREQAESWASHTVRFKLEEGEMNWKSITRVDTDKAFVSYSKGKRNTEG